MHPITHLLLQRGLNLKEAERITEQVVRRPANEGARELERYGIEAGTAARLLAISGRPRLRADERVRRRSIRRLICGLGLLLSGIAAVHVIAPVLGTWIAAMVGVALDVFGLLTIWDWYRAR